MAWEKKGNEKGASPKEHRMQRILFNSPGIPWLDFSEKQGARKRTSPAGLFREKPLGGLCHRGWGGLLRR